MNRDIDLKYIISREYCDSIELANTKDKVVNYGYIVLHYLGLFALAFLVSFIIFFLFYAKSNASYDIQTEIRKARIEACTQAYYEYQDWVDSRYKHQEQNVIIRCSTFASLVFAKES